MPLKKLAGAAIAAIAILGVTPAYATHLQIGSQASLWEHLGADALLALHIGGGAVGILSGAATLSLRKGSRAHRIAGKVFLVSMLIAYTVATCVAPFLSDGQRPNLIAGVMALYLLLSGWAAGARREFHAGVFEFLGLASALLVTGGGVVFMQMGANDPSHTVDGSPPQAFIIFIVAGSVAALGELNVLIRRTISNVARTARHLWRMCFSLFIAAGSFFLGQQQIMPAWLHGSPVLLACALAPLAAMIFWLVWVRFARRFRGAIPAHDEAAA